MKQLIEQLRLAANKQYLAMKPRLDMTTGVCKLVEQHISGIKAYEVCAMMEYWPRRAIGEFVFIVPSGTKETSRKAYLDRMNEKSMWENDAYGDLRRELCTWLADELEKQL